MQHSLLSKTWIAVALLLAALPAKASGQGGTILGKEPTHWQKGLESDDARTRRNAAFAFGRGGKDLTSAVPLLLKLVETDPDASVKEAAAYAVGEIGPTDSPDAMRILGQALLNDPAPKVRRSAAYAIGCYNQHGAPAKGDLIRALKDKEGIVRQNAAWALGRLRSAGSDAVGPLTQKLSSAVEPDPLVRRDVARAIGEIGRPASKPEADRAVNALVRAVRADSDPRVRREALTSLVNVVAPGDTNAAKELRNLLSQKPRSKNSAEIEERYDIAFALGNIGGRDGQAAVPVLVEGLSDPDPNMREKSAGSLANIGEFAGDAVGKLGQLLTEDLDPKVRRNCALALGKIGKRSIAALDNIKKALNPSEPDDVRRYAVEAIAYIGKEAAEKSKNELVRIIREDRAWRVRQRAVWALSSIHNLETSGVVPTLEAVLDETDDETKLVRYEAAVLLGVRLGPKASDKVVDVLVKNLTDKDIKIYTGAGAGVTGGGSEGAGTASVTESSRGDARWLPAMALGAIGPKARKPEVISALNEAAASPDPNVKKHVAEALSKINR